jgi:hypothetical protein
MYYVEGKPFARAAMWLQKSDSELSELMLALTLSGKMPKIYFKGKVVDNPTLDQFKVFLQRSVEVKAGQEIARLANRERQAQYEEEIAEIRCLREEVADLALERHHKKVELSKLLKSVPRVRRNMATLDLFKE